MDAKTQLVNYNNSLRARCEAALEKIDISNESDLDFWTKKIEIEKKCIFNLIDFKEKFLYSNFQNHDPNYMMLKRQCADLKRNARLCLNTKILIKHFIRKFYFFLFFENILANKIDNYELMIYNKKLFSSNINISF